jgi:hypothetical protein
MTMTTYHEISSTIEGQREILFGSFSREDCVYELDAERDSWADQGYKHIKIKSRETTDQPDPVVYADDDDVDTSGTDDCEICGTIEELSHNDETGLALCCKCDDDNQPVLPDTVDHYLDTNPGLKNFDTIEELTSYLTETLIPDLREIGSDGTADDFEDCIAAITHLTLKV